MAAIPRYSRDMSQEGRPSPRIVLVRHGRSAIQHDGRWMPHARVSEYERQYDDAGIRDDDHPPADLSELARGCSVLVASDMRRAVESARRLGEGREPEIQPLIREIRLEPPRWVPVHLPIVAWEAFSYMQWSMRLTLGADHETVRRAEQAATWLIDRAGTSGTVLAVTHGLIRRILTQRLELLGWRCDDRAEGHRNWSAWSVVPTDDPRQPRR